MLVNIRNNGYRKYKYYTYASSPGITSNARFDTDLKKSESTIFLAIDVREHVNNNYQNHIKNFTDDSVLDSLDNGAGLLIPDLKVLKFVFCFLCLCIH